METAEASRMRMRRRRASPAFRARERARRRARREPEYDQQRERKAANRQHIIDRKGSTCSRCGDDFPQRQLFFHHRDPETKHEAVSQMESYSREAIDAEIAKCDVVCAFCHNKIHHCREAVA